VLSLQQQFLFLSNLAFDHCGQGLAALASRQASESVRRKAQSER